jgi:NAD(P)-dependent dehydrogenase (short-subunit alcohol dehydrogenase family)
MFDLTGRHAFVTGAGTGLGRAAALVLARHGAAVTACGRRAEKLQVVCDEVRAMGGRAQAQALDVSQPDSIVSAVSAATAAQGTIDILINNAGLALSTTLLETSDADWDRVQDTNVRGVWLCARAVAKQLIAAQSPGVIVNIASVLGFSVQKGTGPYAASKAGVLQLTRVMASEWARHGIRVNAIAPGYIATNMADRFLASERGQKMLAGIPQRRFGASQDIEGAVLFLASAASAYMTGSTVTVDGGISLGTL